MSTTETELLLSGHPQGEKFKNRDQMIFDSVSRIKARGVLFDEYCLGVEYQNSAEAMGQTATEDYLDKQFVKVSQQVWIYSITKNLCLEEVLDAVIEHEFIHEVHRNRVARRETWPLFGDCLELLIHSVQLEPNYVKGRKRFWSNKVSEWLKEVNRSWVSDDVLATYGYALNSELKEPEYLRALGVI